jgi:hypothetical protein
VAVGHGRFEQWCHNSQRRFRIDQGRGRARLERLNATARKVAAPQAHCILANAKRLRNARAGPARQRQQYRSRPIRLRAIATRYDKRARNFLAGVYAASILIWLN